MELISLFFLTIVSGLLSSINLSLIGSQLAARGQSVQMMVLTSAMSLGIILTMGLSHDIDEQHAYHFLPLVGGVLFALTLMLITQFIAKKTLGNKSSYYISIYAILLALTHLVTNLIPGLETHMAQNYFGDIAVMNNFENMMNIVMTAFSLVFILWKWRDITFISFQHAIYGNPILNISQKKHNYLFWLLTFVSLIMSVHYLGFLFTISMLFIPSVLIRKKNKSLKVFTIQLILISAVAEISGFVLSLYLGNLPTTPVIIIALLFWSLIFNFSERIYYLRHH